MEIVERIKQTEEAVLAEIKKFENETGLIVDSALVFSEEGRVRLIMTTNKRLR